jgi:hypothetical protein
MKFRLRKGFRKTLIIAETEHENERFGFRAQAPYREIRLTGSRAVFNYRIKDIHPDLLGLLCMVMFYPFCKNKVTFPKPVSSRFQEAFSFPNLPWYDLVDGRYQPVKSIEITNVDPDLEPYSGSELSLSFGGGFDSLAVQLLFPEAIVIHESGMKPDGKVRKDGASDYMKKLAKRGVRAYDIVNTQRYCLSKPADWSTWPACAANNILLATDLNIGYIMTGTSIDAKFLNNNGKYHPAILPEHYNPWNRAFDLIGLKLFSPVWGVSEAATLKIVADQGAYRDAVYCTKDNGYPCHSCFKCFRKDLYASATGVMQFEPGYWERYNNEAIKSQLYHKPLHGANCFSFGMQHLRHLDWIEEAARYLDDTSHWSMKYYRRAFDIMPPELRQTTEERLARHLAPLEDATDLENWDALRYVETQ